VGLSLRPERLRRCRDIAKLPFKYGRADMVAGSGLDEPPRGPRR